MKRNTLPVTVTQPATEGKLVIDGVGTFVPAAMKGTRKADLDAIEPALSADQKQTLWNAISKGEMPEPAPAENA